jgi:hypothetical protein
MSVLQRFMCEPGKGFLDDSSVDVLVSCSDGFGHVEGMVPSFDGVEVPGSAKLCQYYFESAQTTKSIARSREEEHGCFDPVEMCIPKSFLVVCGMKRVSEEDKAVYTDESIGNHL